MPRNKKSDDQSKPKSGRVQFQGFLSLSLTRAEKQHVRANPIDPSNHGQLLADAVFAGYKCSLSFNRKEDCYILTAYGNVPGHLDAGYAMSIHHVDFSTCFDVLAFCLEEAGKAGSLTQWLGNSGEVDW